jgi:hypothetical protein
MIFDAPSAGVYQLSAGNPKAPSRNYDVAALRGSLPQGRYQTAMLGAGQPNPAYQPPQITDSGEEEGSDINTDPWHFRKTVSMIGQGGGDGANLWRVELDLEAIAHNGGRLEALRLVRNDRQLPYVNDYAGVERSFTPGMQAQPAPAKQKSQWLISLPHTGIPITRLHFTVPEALFQRNILLYEVYEEVNREEMSPETPQGKPMRILASSTWTRIRADAPASFELVLQQMPQTNRLILETENGDNAPIHPAKVEAYYRAPRLLFRSKPNKAPLYLYYGQPDVSAPQYDLNLIAADLLSTPPQEAQLGKEDALKATPWWEPPVPVGNKKHLFWGIMFMVVVALLVVIAKLLPEEESHA